MKQTSARPAEITYTDGEEKTIVFPEINRGGIKNLRVDGVDVNRINRLPAFFGGLIIGALCIFSFLFPLTTERAVINSDAKINTKLLNTRIKRLEVTNQIYAQKLASEKLHWVSGVWEDRSKSRQPIVNSTPTPSK